MDAPPKLQNFAWRVCAEALPVKWHLFRRQVVTDPICDRCSQADESIWHVLVHCPASEIAWSGARIYTWAKQFQFLNFPMAIASLYQQHRAEGVKEFFVHAWIAWTLRNKSLFEPGFTNAEVLAEGFRRYVVNYTNFKQSRRIRPAAHDAASSSNSAGITNWCLPLQGSVKLNIDACVLGDVFGLGAVIRDAAGTVLLVASKRVPAFDDATMAESMAMQWGVDLAVQWDFQVSLWNLTVQF